MGEAELGEMVRYLVLVTVLFVLTTQTAQAGTRHKPHAPYWFVKDARCVHSHEASAWKWTPDFHPGYSYWNKYWTGLQFDKGTWQRANALLHSHVDPHTGNVRAIILHAYAIVREDGGSWREWPNSARMCGLPTF